MTKEENPIFIRVKDSGNTTSMPEEPDNARYITVDTAKEKDYLEYLNQKGIYSVKGLNSRLTGMHHYEDYMEDRTNSYLQLSDEERSREVTISIAELHSMMYQLDWIQILQDAVEARPTSWGVQEDEEYKAVAEWRNASDELIAPVWKNLYHKIESEME